MSNRVDEILKELGLPVNKMYRPPEPEREKRERGPCGKVSFSSEGSAKNGARSLLRSGRTNTSFLRTYFCDTCKAWHMSSSYFGDFAKPTK